MSPKYLNAAVQRTIDRLIFLRICEDRGIESTECPWYVLDRSLNNGLLGAYS